MGDRTQNRLDRLNASLASEDGGESEGKVEKRSRVNSGSLLQRESALSKLASGKQRNVQVLMHDPSRVRIWAQHNRDYALLSVERCSDLIEGFKRSGKQEFPAVVRKVVDDPAYDFELICGARRRWTATHLGWDLLIEVRELSDRQAFILQDLENRDREDISDYERAVDYTKALPIYFEGNRSDMARFLEIDPSNFAKMLELAKLPSAIVNAYGDVRELKTHHGVGYKRLLADARTKRRVMDRAKALKGQGLDGKRVFSALNKAAQDSSRVDSPRPQRFGLLTATTRANGSVQLVLDAPVGDNVLHVQSVRAAFDDYLSSLQNDSA